MVRKKGFTFASPNNKKTTVTTKNLSIMANVNSFRSSVNTMEQYIYINGVRMNYAEYKKQLKAKEKAKKDEKKSKRAQAVISQLPPYID